MIFTFCADTSMLSSELDKHPLRGMYFVKRNPHGGPFLSFPGSVYYSDDSSSVGICADCEFTERSIDMIHCMVKVKGELGSIAFTDVQKDILERCLPPVHTEDGLMNLDEKVEYYATKG